MEKISVDKINLNLRTDRKKFISDCERDYSSQLMTVASAISDRCYDRPIILLSGPSGSGKTTTALRLENMLEDLGHPSKTLSLDDYFLPHNDSYENIDFESPERIDIPFLKKQLDDIANCKEVVLPDFNFRTQRRIPKEKYKREKNEIVVIEGIHALNPDVTGEGDDFSNNIYVSVRSRIVDKYGVSFHPSKIRLIRRIIRDTQFRARTAQAVFHQFKSVERGENLYIMPYKERSHFDINTFMGYELSVYKDYMMPVLSVLRNTYPEYDKFISIEKIFEQIDSLDSSLVVPDSLVREFYGGSKFKYWVLYIKQKEV